MAQVIRGALSAEGIGVRAAIFGHEDGGEVPREFLRQRAFPVLSGPKTQTVLT